MTVEYLDLADYVAIASEVTGLDAATVMKVANLDLADWALHAPAAGFGDADFYPGFVDKAAVLIVRLGKDHPTATCRSRAVQAAARSPRNPLSQMGQAARAGGSVRRRRRGRR